MVFYSQKLIISGGYFELYDYEITQRRDFTRKKKLISEKEDDDIEVGEKGNSEGTKRTDSIHRTRTEIRRLVNSNTDFSKFYTLTFKENLGEVTVANKRFNKFIMRMEYRYGKFIYLAVIEFQRRGAVHYHFLCNLPFIIAKEIEKIWGHGFIKIRRIKHVTNLGAYFCKYLHKDMTDKRLFRKKKYFCSENIERPMEVYDKRVIEKLLTQYDLHERKPDYEASFTNEYTGKVEYKQFRVKSIVA